MPHVSIVVPPNAADSRPLLASLDRQSLPAADFEVLVADDERSPTLTALLDDIAAHRTNLIRVPVPEQDAAAALLGRASGAYVLAVPAGRTLTPRALELLLDRAVAADADVCRGLTGRAGVRPERLPAADELVGPAGALRRRRGLSVDIVAADLAGKDAETPDESTVAAVTTTLCFLDGSAPGRKVPPESGGPVQAQAESVVWRDGVLELTATLSAPAETVVASVYSDETGVEWRLPDALVEGDRVTLRLDPRDVPGPGRLPAGVWWPSLRVGRSDLPVLVRAAPKVAHGATLRDLRAVSFAEQQRLAVDVGARSHQPIRRIDPATATIVEDSRGSLLTAPVPTVDLRDGERVTGQLRLGRMPVTAWLEHEPGVGTVLRAWVSGLAGASVLHTRFGSAPFAPTGAQLVIDGVGGMRVTAAPKTPDAQHQPAGKGGRPAASAARPSPASIPERAVRKARRVAGRAVRAVRR